MTGAEGGKLTVEFAGEQRVLEAGDELTFGRSGDLVIDENRYLHRLLGRFHAADGMWWLTNVGRAIALTVSDAESPSFARLSPGATVPLSFGAARVTFDAGGAMYQVNYEIEGTSARSDQPPGEELVDHDIEATKTASSLPLSDEQRLLLVALAEVQLREPGRDIELPTNRQLAASLGWTITKLNRKLDGLCRKYAAAGVRGLHGSSGELAKDRRSRLVEHAIQTGIICSRDLVLLGGAAAASREA